MDDRLRAVILTAMPEERAAFRGRPFGADVLVAATGVGPANAARAAARLFERHRPRLVVGAGVAGALSEDLGVGDIFVARRVLDAEGTAPPPDPELTARASAMPGTRSGTLVCVERPLVTASEKASWAAKVDAPAAVDMESSAWARAAAAHGIPYVVLRAISDHALDELPGYLSRCMDKDGGIRRWAVALHAMAEPSTIPVLRRMQHRVRDCADRLAAFVEHFLAAGV